MIATSISACRVCGDTELESILDLGDFALCGRFPGPGEPDPPRAPLQLLFCHGCSLVQLRHDFDLDELYRHDYGYRSGINATMRNHLASITESVTRLAGLAKGDAVLDIGCNDGTLLQSYKTAGIQRIGLDPTVERFRAFLGDEILAAPEYFSARRFADLARGRKARIITSIAMFYDLPDPHTFVADVAACLDDRGIWLFEQSYLPAMIESRSVDTICHEHLEYYSLAPVARLLSRHGLRIFDVTLNQSNGGSFRVSACHERAPHVRTARVDELLAREKLAGYHTLAPYRAFQTATHAVRDRIVSFVHQQKSAGLSIYAYGASTKGNSLLQFCQLDNRSIVAAADRNPAKWGHRTPATNIPIASEADVRALRPDFFLVLPWHFKDEFLVREREFLESGGRFVFPLPEFAVVDAADRTVVQ